MKRPGHLIEKIAETDNLLAAFYKACRGKRLKADVQDFSENLDERIFRLRNALLSGDAKVGNYTYFMVHDPKPRLICAASFDERVLHHALMNVCHPYFERQLIWTTYATRPGKGLYQALERAKKAACRYPYVAKFDFRKYFDSIDHEILKRKLSLLFKDRALLDLFGKIIDSYSASDGKGLPIGNLTSQYFANYYLSAMDHRCREVLKVGEYIRYMDDFLIFEATAERLEKAVADVVEYSESELSLQLKLIERIRAEDGVSFCGYRIFPEKILLTRRSKKRLGRKMRSYSKALSSGTWTGEQYLGRITPVLAFVGYAYTKGLRRKIMSYDRETSRL